MKRNMLILNFFSIFVLLASACGQAPTPEPVEVTKEVVVIQQAECAKNRYVVTSPIIHPYLTEMNRGAEQAAADLGIELVWLSAADFNTPKQVELTESALALPCIKGITVVAADANALEAVLKEANSLGITAHQMSGCGSEEDGNRRAAENISQLCYSTEFLTAAATVAEKLAKLMDGKGNVVIATQRNDVNQKLREDGFVDYMQKNYPDIKILGSVADCDSPTGTIDCAENALSTYPTMNTYYGTGFLTVIGGISAFKAAGREDIFISAVDDGAEVLQGLTDGTIALSYSQQPWGQGYMAVYINYLMAEKNLKPTVRFIDTGITLMTTENVATYKDDVRKSFDELKKKIDTEYFK